jgi:hypothetical protein
MKRNPVLMAAAGLLTALTGCDDHVATSYRSWSDADLIAVTNVSQTAGIPVGLKRLEVDNRFGAVRITGATNQTCRWTWKLTVHARSNAAAQQFARRASCNAELEGGQLKLVLWLPDASEPHSVQSDFEIWVPKSAAVQIQNRFGRTDLATLDGEVEVADENGPVEIRDVGGCVRARTSFNTLSVRNTGPATLEDENGAVEAIAVHGLLDAQTSFNSLVARDINGAASLRNRNGRIEATGIGGALDARTSFNSLVARDIGGPVRLRDQNGGIELLQAGGDADVETSFNSLRVEGIQGDAIMVNRNGRVDASGVTGSVSVSTSFAAIEVAGAGSKFVCHNQNGPIRLRATSAAVTNIVAKTSFATLAVSLPAGLKPAIQARTSLAEVESDFPVLMKPPGVDPFAGIAPETARIALLNRNGKISVVHD